MNPKHIHYLHFDSIDSTNNWAKKNIKTLDPDALTCITALEQTAGRGRFNRQWVSGRGENITATLFFSLPLSSPIISNVGQVLSLSCVSVLKQKGFSPQIKWPNDLLLSGKKVAGILSETAALPDRLAIILGIGINVNMRDELLTSIDQPATSLAQLSGKLWQLEQILEPLLQQFLRDLDLLKREGFVPFQSSYENVLAFRGEPITCADGMQLIRGICHSINKEGKLNLLLQDGSLTTLSAGEVKTSC